MIYYDHMPWKCGQELGQTLDARLGSWESGASPGRDALKVRGLRGLAKAWQRLGKVGSVAGISWDFTRVLPVFYRLSILYAVYNTILLYIYIYMCEDDIISYPAGATVLPFRSGALGSYELSFPTIGKLGLKIFKLLGHGITMCVWRSTEKLGDWLSLGHRIGVSNFYHHKTVMNCNHRHINQQKLSVQPTTFPTNHQ